MTTTTNTEALTTAVADLAPATAQELREAFTEMFNQADEWAAKAALINVTSIEQTREMKLARESRLALKDIRVQAEKTRKRLKEHSLRTGKAIDGIANVMKALIVPIEERLQEHEDFAKRAEEARVSALRNERNAMLTEHGTGARLDVDVGTMPNDIWEAMLTASKAERANREAAAAAEREARAEAEREAEREASARKDRERAAAAENEKLRAAMQQAVADKHAAEEALRKVQVAPVAAAEARQCREALDEFFGEGVSQPASADVIATAREVVDAYRAKDAFTLGISIENLATAIGYEG